MPDHMTAEQLRAELTAIALFAAQSRGPLAAGLSSTGHELALGEVATRLDALAARLSGMAAVPWQPIETAPKDGRSILVGVGGWGKRVAQAEWDQWGDAADEGGWRCGRPGAKGYDDAGFEPTHWRELPAAPEPPHV